MKSLQKFSAHRYGGWKGQYDRMKRWHGRFNRIASQYYQESVEITDNDYFDTMFSCFQNIFFLKDWLVNDLEIPTTELNVFINLHPEMGICRDICNGTKHFDINYPSVDSEFSIIREYDHCHEVWNTSEFKVIILAGGEKYEPWSLQLKCIELWDSFLKNGL